MPSAFMKEDTTPLPRARGAATIRPSTQPSRTRTNSRYFRPDSTGRAREAVTVFSGAAVRPVSRSTRGRTSSSRTMMPDTG